MNIFGAAEQRAPQHHHDVVRIDRTTGFVEFPQPGDSKKHLLPVYDDPEEVKPNLASLQAELQHHKEGKEDYWMPDKLCKICYSCEVPFTMYRRRHHCRMCGQVFCNPCSSFYIELESGTQGPVRSCRLCFEQLGEIYDRDLKAPPKRRTVSGPRRPELQVYGDPGSRSNSSVCNDDASYDNGSGQGQRFFETAESRDRHVGNLQTRASLHLEAVVSFLVDNANNIAPGSKGIWKGIIVQLVREVVAYVDPDVRAGDSLDIRPYVKLKIIPGGPLEDNKFVNGVVFRKNVSHKRMGMPRENPRVLLLGGGIDFQREDHRLSSLDTLIEQEDRYTEILVEKIMTLKPDIILVGRSVARKAQEMLCEQNVAVMQSVKLSLLERIARMTGAIMLPSTDHMIQQYGEECLGSCDRFWLQKVVVSEAVDGMSIRQPSANLKRITKNQRGVTYAYLEGCPPELGGTIILRGASRKTLNDVKNIISYGIMLAYHLRLEVSYYTDRCGRLPESPDISKSDYESDDDLFDPLSDSQDGGGVGAVLGNETRRGLLSASLDVDISLPYRQEILGMSDEAPFSRAAIESVSPQDYQTLLVTSLLMTHSRAQRSRAEVKGIRFYTAQDVALGQFLVESCFQLTPGRQNNGRIMMMDHTLSFIHRPGRVDISVSRTAAEPGVSSAPTNVPSGSNQGDDTATWSRDPLRSPIRVHSYCKECQAVVTPDVMLSDETWKMSFGKFLEITFYNRSARCRTGGCSHFLRDDHVLFFVCEGYSARFEFVPMHPYSLHVRNSLTLPSMFHDAVVLNFLNEYSVQSSRLFEDFRGALKGLEKMVRDVLGSRPEVMSIALADIAAIEQDIEKSITEQAEEVNTVMDIMSGSRSKQQSVDEGGCRDRQLMQLTKKFPLRLRRDLMHKASQWNMSIEVVHRFIDSLESLSQQPSSSGNGTELPDDDDLLTLRASFMNLSVSGLSAEDTEDKDSVVASLIRNTSIAVEEGIPAISQLVDDFTAYPVPAGDDKRSSTIAMDEKRGSTVMDKRGGSSSKSSMSLSNEDKRASTRITKAFQRFMGKENVKRAEFAVDLSEFSGGRLGLRPGRTGEVIGVVEEELSTVIAYSLASQEYYNQIQSFLKEGSSDLIVKDRPYSSKGDILSSPADFTDEQRDIPGAVEQKDTFDAAVEDRQPVDSGQESNLQDEPASSTGDAAQGKLKKAASFAKFSHLVKQHDEPFLKMHPASEDDPPEQSEEDQEVRAEDPLHFMHFNTSTVNFESQGAGYLSSPVHDSQGVITSATSPEESPNAQTAATAVVSQEPLEETSSPGLSRQTSTTSMNASREAIMISQRKTHIKHRFSDIDDKNNITCKFICHSYWATQFQALRAEFLDDDDDEGYIRSLSLASRWNAQGGKSGASFSRTTDNRFVVKHITRTELQMFLDFAPAYFEYMANTFYHKLPTALCKILGVYQIGYHNKVTGKKVMEQVVVMENLFFERNITRTFDLKGSSRARYVDMVGENGEKVDDLDAFLLKTRRFRQHKGPQPVRADANKVCMDDNLMELTKGRPLPLKHKAKVLFHKAVMNDTLFLSMINIVDYSILVGIDEDSHELVVGIIDYMRQYDIIKKMERMGKSVGTMIAGQAEPTVIQPPQYRKRFQVAMDRYFMTVPDKW
eukprot:CAMPEP_0185038048 /NCGR_PEP_ID=MMETSP1103-20130426/33223_1 /TAXON_ID=36769 /ORGANISM="Paraphysomonas bandaiensis, Strain Caron Lab Isolate" /LENGTH=1645 /DNA_ID=CAMNT_0027576313 /DNA_START=45 /DNA_END=4979 /DNA_ORIENTATION=+